MAKRKAVDNRKLPTLLYKNLTNRMRNLDRIEHKIVTKIKHKTFIIFTINREGRIKFIRKMSIKNKNKLNDKNTSKVKSFYRHNTTLGHNTVGP